ncbi:MAG: acyltransferase [Aquabacterium sp.]|jgi:1-acyl-sn-glycerol-3-phosphate acyltransferase|nr:MAG: acyltransferase [Aquabacterium sp.]
MFSRLLPVLRGSLASLVLLANVVAIFSAMIPVALVKLSLPFKPVRKLTNAVLDALAGLWVTINNCWIGLTNRSRWNVRVAAGLKRRGWYLVSANHQSWVDILVLQRVFNGLPGRIPLLKFFLKRELIYVPIMGLAWWALDFPFMRRSGRGSTLAKDLETARRACEKFRMIPTSVISFAEGTRFSKAKKDQQRSPYRHLLKPKLGGISVALATMGDRFDALLDVTIVYPNGVPNFWDLLSGKVRDVVVRVQEIAIPAELKRGEHAADPAYRQRLQAWIGEMWADKDRLIEQLQAARLAQADAVRPG